MAETLTLGKALNEGLRRAMEDDPKVLIMGEDVGKLGGVFRITDGLQKDFGEDRVIDTPLAESGIIGTAIGLAIRGYRPVCEIQFDGFVYPAYDQIVSQVAKMHYRSQGKVQLPIVDPDPVRRRHRRGRAPLASRPRRTSRTPPASRSSPAPTRPTRTSMIQQAIASDDPIIFFEPKRRYWEKGEVDTDASTPRTRCTPRGSSGRAPTHRARVRPDGAHRLDAAAAAERGRARRSRSSTCARCRRWTCAPVFESVAPDRPRRRRARGAGQRSASAPRSPPGSPRSASTRWRRRCCG